MSKFVDRISLAPAGNYWHTAGVALGEHMAQFTRAEIRRIKVTIAVIVLLMSLPGTYYSSREALHYHRQVQRLQIANKGFGQIGDRVGSRFGSSTKSTGRQRWELGRQSSNWMIAALICVLSTVISVAYIVHPHWPKWQKTLNDWWQAYLKRRQQRKAEREQQLPRPPRR